MAKWKTALGDAATAPAHSTVWIQQALNKLGADPVLSTDGKFGPLSSAALKEFQQSHGLPADGNVSAETLTALESALAAS